MAVASGNVFVGRARELAVLLAGLESSLAGDGRMFLVAGEPGIGKSRLVEQFAAAARERDALVLWGRCWEAGGAPAYWPWVQCLRTLVRSADPSSLREHIGPGGDALAQMLPELRNTLPDLPETPALDPEAARFRLFDATAEFLRRVCEDAPGVLVLEDVHAADTPTMLLLEFVARSLTGTRALIVATYRDVEVDRSHPLAATLVELRRHAAAQELALTGLDGADIARFVEEATGEVPPDDLVDALEQGTEGNPLFVGEIVRLLAAEGRLGSAAGTAALTPLPQGIRDVIGRRLERLSDRCLHLLGLAAVLGRDFPLDVLERLSEQPVEELLEILEEATAARVTSEIPGTLGAMRFSHSLIRDALYEQLSAVQRARLHRRTGEILEALHGKAGERLAELAHHFSLAAPTGGADKAVAAALAAGDHAAGQLAYEEAARLYRMALDALPFSPASEPGLQCDLLLRLGDVEARAGDLPGARRTFLAAASAAKAIGSAERLGAAALGYGGRFVWTKGESAPGLVPLLEDALAAVGEVVTPLRSRLLARLAGALRDRPERQPRESLSEQAVAIARETRDPAALAWALAARFASIWFPGNADERLEIATELLEVAQAAGDLEHVYGAHLWRWVSFLELGDIGAVHREQATLERLSSELRQAAQLWLEAALAASLALFEGRFEDAERMMDEAMRRGERAQNWDATVAYRMQTFLLARELGRRDGLHDLMRRTASEYAVYPMFRCALAVLLAEDGRVDEARTIFRQLTADDLAGLPFDNEWLYGVCLLGEVAARTGEGAEVLYERLRPYEHLNAVAPGEAMTGSVARVVGMLAAALERFDDAEDHFARAREANERMGARPWVAQTLREHAAMLDARDGPGDRERAAGLRASADEIGRALGLVAPAPDGAGTPMQAPARCLFRREGEYFSVAWDGASFRLKDAKGLRHLAILLASPGREHHALELVAAVEGHDARPAAPREDAGGSGAAADVLLDAPARAAYKQRLVDLEEDIEEALAFGDAERAARAEEERAAIAEELARGMGLGGRARQVTSDAERARVNVTRAIRSAMARIARESPALGAHLEATITTGTFCSYVPDPRVPVDWHL